MEAPGLHGGLSERLSPTPAVSALIPHLPERAGPGRPRPVPASSGPTRPPRLGVPDDHRRRRAPCRSRSGESRARPRQRRDGSDWRPSSHRSWPAGCRRCDLSLAVASSVVRHEDCRHARTDARRLECLPGGCMNARNILDDGRPSASWSPPDIIRVLAGSWSAKLIDRVPGVGRQRQCSFESSCRTRASLDQSPARS